MDAQFNNSFRKKIKLLSGVKPYRLNIYYEALLHVSKEDNGLDNERLEYLGDAVLDLVTAEFLFKKYPKRKEGFLTSLKSKIVSRESLSDISFKLGLQNLIIADQSVIKNTIAFKSIAGNTLEALVGAIFLDRGYAKSRKFIIKKILQGALDIDKISNTVVNYKSVLYEWAQAENKPIEMKIINEEKNKNRITFTIDLILDKVKVATGTGFNKKKAEQDAARRFLIKNKMLEA